MRVSYILSHCLRFRHTPDLFLHLIFWPVASRLNNYSKVPAGTNALAWGFSSPHPRFHLPRAENGLADLWLLLQYLLGSMCLSTFGISM